MERKARQLSGVFWKTRKETSGLEQTVLCCVTTRKSGMPPAFCCQWTVKNLVVRSLIEDYDGNIWLGTEYNGLGKVTGDRIQLGYGASYKLQNASVRSLLVTPEEELYIGSTTGLAIMNLKNESITDFSRPETGWSIISSVACYRTGTDISG